jgi:hypothetical protein
MQIRILPGPIEGVTNTVAELPRRVIRAGAGVIPGWKWLPPGRCAPPQQGHGFSLRVDFDECGGRTAGGQRDCRSRVSMAPSRPWKACCADFAAPDVRVLG